MRLQLWSYNYDPEPLGIGPVSTVWARTMASRGHEVDVVAAHPHYPSPDWGRRYIPYREVRDGIPVTRLPLLVGRESGRQRILQESSFLASQAVASPFLGRPDVLVSVSPSFPALLPALVSSRARRTPWVVWLQDILPDGASATGYLSESGRLYRWSRSLEDSAYRAASKIVVLSDSFRRNLRGKGVPDSKLSLIYNPATLPVRMRYRASARPTDQPRIICMGNIGRSQGLAEIVRDFEGHPGLEAMGARLIITGSGVAEAEVRAAISTDRVEMTGLLSRDALEDQLQRASLAAVTQAYEAGEFNVPSKLMNYLAVGLPVIASVRRESEAARILHASGGGLVAPAGCFGSTAAAALDDPVRLGAMARAGHAFAQTNLTVDALGDQFERVLARSRGLKPDTDHR